MPGLPKMRDVPIKPIYLQEVPNDPIEVGATPIEYTICGVQYRDSADVVFRFLPTDRLELRISLENHSPLIAFELLEDGAFDGTLKLVDRGVVIEAMVMSVDSDRGIVFGPKRSIIDANLETSRLSSAVFHVCNFPEFLGPDDVSLIRGAPPCEGCERLGRVLLKAEGWLFEVAAIEQTEAQCKSLKRQGGFAITHVARIAREDGDAFSSTDLKEQLTLLHQFLSFALGRRVGICFPVGFDHDGTRVFEQWGMGIAADRGWNSTFSWFDARHAELLQQVFPGFVKLWKCPTWQKPLRHALYWYIGANDRRIGIGVDTGLILAQTALELLAWTHCVIDRKMVSSRAFSPGGLGAADKLRLLVSSLNLPLPIPSEVFHLRACTQQLPKVNWIDSLDAITAIRNSLIHPDARSFSHEAVLDAWNLSLWYVERILLRLCLHDGKCANRLKVGRRVGQVENMP